MTGPTREELDQAIAQASEAMLVCDPDGRIVGANERACALTGYDRDGLLARSFDDLADPDAAADAGRLLPALRQDATLALDAGVRCKDGSTTRVHLSLRSLRMGERPHAVIRVARRRRAADRLPEDPEFIRAVLNTPGTLVVSVCREGKVCFASAGFEALCGLEFRAIRGKTLWDLNPDAAQSFALRDALQRPEPLRTVQTQWPMKDGARRTIAWTNTLVGAIPPAPQYVLMMGQVAGAEPAPLKRLPTRRATPEGAARDLEKRILELTTELEEARSEHEALAYTLAHDLRAPLRAMSGFSHTLIEEYANRPLDEAGLGYALKITESARRMDELIEDLLVFSRLTRTPVCLGPVPLTTIMPEILRAFGPEIRDHRALIEQAVPPLDVVADWTLLFLVLCHLLSNALKFARPGVASHVKIRAERRRDRIRIEFEDNGIGIPDEYCDRIFGVFQRLNKAEDFKGTGMGLAIVRKALDRMNGRVGLESEVGRGSRFWVELLAAEEL